MRASARAAHRPPAQNEEIADAHVRHHRHRTIHGIRSKALAFLFLGCVFIVNGTLWNLFVAWSAARATMSVIRSSRGALWLNRVIGATFILLGVRLATQYET